MTLLAMLAVLATPSAEVRLVYFGGTGGVSAHAGRNRAHTLLGDDFRLKRAGPLVFAHRGRLALDVRVELFHAFLAAGPHRREVLREDAPVLVGPFEVLLGEDLGRIEGLVPGLTRVAAREVDLVDARGTRLRVLELPGADHPFEVDPFAWELRFATVGERLTNIGRPLNDGARRAAVVARLRGESPGVITLAAGGDVEDFSFLGAGEPDRQRPHTWKALRGLTALAPGAAEAAFGVEALAREARAHGVDVLAANLAEVPFAGWKLVERDGVRVLLVGVVDPMMGAVARWRAFGARAVGEVGQAVCGAVAEAREELGARPEVVVVFGRVRPGSVAGCHEVDVLLGDFEDRGFTAEAMDVEVADPALRARERRPLPVVVAGRLRVGVVEVVVEAGEVVRVRSRAEPVLAEVEAVPELARAVQETRQTAYAAAQAVLVPDEGPTAAETWQRMAANALRARYGAEVAVIPRVPVPWSMSGAVTRLTAAANLNVPDRVQVVSLSEEQVRALAGLVGGDVVTSGLAPGPTVLGRALDARERYRVVTTDALRETARYADALAGEAEAGAALRDAVVSELETADLAWLRAEQVGKEARWLLDVRGVELGLGRTDNFGETSATFRETRATAAAQTSVSTRGAVAVRRDSTAVDWVNTVEAAFAQQTVAGEDLETADVAKGSSELQVHAWSLLSGVPYTSATYETEFTPTADERKKRLEGALGLLWAGSVVKSVRLAALAGHDFAATNTKEPEVGVLGALGVEAPLGPVVWWLDAEGRYYVPGLGDQRDEGALGVVLKGRSGIDVPIAGGLALSVFGDVFAFRGQAPGLRQFGSNLVSGVALKFDQVFKATQRP